MEIIGILNRISEIKEFENKQTGKKFPKRNITLVVPEQYYSTEGTLKQFDNEFIFTLAFDAAQNFNIEPGTKLKIFYSSSVSTGEYMYENKIVRKIILVN